jgi:hypothetical protein
VHVFAQEHLPHSPDPDPLQQLVSPDGEAARFAVEELLGLEVGQHPVPD